MVQRALRWVTVTGLALATCMTNTGLLWAQSADEATKKQALDTFNEARRLQDQGRAAEACALFRRSAELVDRKSVV